MDFEIIIDENATKLDSIWSGFRSGNHNLGRSAIFWQLEPNQSKMLLISNFTYHKYIEFNDLILFKKKTHNKNLLLAKKLIDEVKIPDWEIKKQILTKKKIELNKLLKTELPNITKKINIWTNYKLKPFKIFLAYSPEPFTSAMGGCVFPSSNSNIVLRLSLNSKVKDSLSLITHELLHAVIKNKPICKKINNIDHAIEEAIFDLMCLKIDYYNKKFNWKKQIELEIYNRNGQHQKYIYEIYEMLKPILHGKDDLIWKYIDWKKLKKISKGKK